MCTRQKGKGSRQARFEGGLQGLAPKPGPPGLPEWQSIWADDQLGMWFTPSGVGGTSMLCQGGGAGRWIAQHLKGVGAPWAPEQGVDEGGGAPSRAAPQMPTERVSATFRQPCTQLHRATPAPPPHHTSRAGTSASTHHKCVSYESHHCHCC